MSIKINSRTNSIESGFETGGDINVTPDGAGNIVLDGLSWPNADGTANQVIETDGAGTLSFVTPAAGGGGGSGGVWQIVSTQTASASASIDFTLPSTFASFKVILIDVTPTTDDVALTVRTSTDGGSTFTSTAGAYEYGGAGTGTGGSGTTEGSTSATSGFLTDATATIAVGNASDEHVSGEVQLLSARTAGKQTLFKSDLAYVRADNTAIHYEMVAGRVVAEDNNAFQFLFSSGTIASGTFVLLGLDTTAVGGRGVGGTGNIVQQVITQDGAVATGTTTMPLDDTIPQITEGDEFMTVSITPTNSNNILVIESCANFATSGDHHTGMALFQDSTADALASGNERQSANSAQQMKILHRMTAGTTSSTTFRIRIGANSAGTTTFNGRLASTRLYGGVQASYIMVTEIDPGNVLTTTTTDATQTTIGSLSITSGTSQSFTIKGHGREDATGDTFSSVILGCIRNQGGTTALVGALDIVEFNDAGASTWDITAEANDSTDALDIKVTGEAAHTIDWKLITESIEE